MIRMFVSVTMAGLFVLSVSMRAQQTGMGTGTAPAEPAPQVQDAAAQAAAAAAEDQRNGALFAAACQDCHDLGTATSMRRSRSEWEMVVQDMTARGASVTAATSPLIVKHLARNYGIVNVNRATAADMVLTLWIAEKDAAAIVAHRTANGPFANFDAVLAVPGIDVAKLKEAADFIIYQ